MTLILSKLKVFSQFNIFIRCISTTQIIYHDCPRKANTKIFRSFIKCNVEVPKSKISVIGMGKVGEAVVANLLFMNITNDIGFIDIDEDKVKAMNLNFRQLTAQLNHAKIDGRTSYDAIVGSKICVISAGARPKFNDDRLTVLQENAGVLKKILVNVVKFAPDTIILLVLNPVDIMTFITTRVTGFPPEKILGSGTNLDTGRLRFMISQKYNVGIESCEGWVLGEHGLSSMVAWSTCKVGGIFIGDINTNMGIEGDQENWNDVHEVVKQGGPAVTVFKEYTNWAVALSVTEICNDIINNTKAIRTITVPAKGFHGICDDVYLSLPAVLGRNGVLEIVDLPLTDNECAALQKSSKFLFENQNLIKL